MQSQRHPAIDLRVIVIVFMTLFCCSDHQKNKIIKLTLINEMQDCSDVNIFYKLVRSDTELNFDSKRDSIVFLLLADSISNERNYNLLFPAVPQSRIELTVFGFFLDDLYDGESYGCAGSRQVEVTQILGIRDVTESMNFSIDDR